MNYMTLRKKDGTTCIAEIVITFKLDNNANDYVIYKCDNEYYCARYSDDGVKTDLITDLTIEEKKILSNIFENLMKEGIL